MSIVVTCPQCGGIIGAADGDSSGYPCTCHADESAAASATATPAMSAAARAATMARKPRVCCQCGKDLTGHRRYKDSVGYWCTACHKLDLNKNKPQGERCDDCSRIVPEEKLHDFDGKRLCGRCVRERRELTKKRLKVKVTETHYREHEKRNLLLLVLVFLFLAGLVLLSYYGVIGEPL